MIRLRSRLLFAIPLFAAPARKQGYLLQDRPMLHVNVKAFVVGYQFTSPFPTVYGESPVSNVAMAALDAVQKGLSAVDSCLAG